MSTVNLTVNGRPISAEIEPRTSLADFLRIHQGLTGTHLGCEHGVCGACTILLNGAPARSCIAFAVALDGSDVRTVEGFEDDPVMAKVREAFHIEHALQCGFCTPGMLITSRDIVTRFATLDEKRIRTELSGNLCRCTGYLGIVNAIQRVLREMPAELRLGNTPPSVSNDPARAARPFQAFDAKSEAAPSPSLSAEALQPPLLSGRSRIVEHFLVERPPAEVWRLFDDLPRMAKAMPGAELTARNSDDLMGRMRVAFGPIKAGFDGKATVARDDETMTGTLRGGGSDRRGGSRAKGEVTYRLTPAADGNATRVEITLDYQLQGPLAQFARSGLVRDFASRLIAEFARNLSADLSGRVLAAPRSPASFKAGAIFWSVLWARIKRLMGL